MFGIVIVLCFSRVIVTSEQGNSVAVWKKDMSGHNLRTSLSIWSNTSLSLKYVLQELSGSMFNGWSLGSPGITITSSKNNNKYNYIDY